MKENKMAKVIFKKLSMQEKKEIKAGFDLVTVVEEPPGGDDNIGRAPTSGFACDAPPPTPAKESLCLLF